MERLEFTTWKSNLEWTPSSTTCSSGVCASQLKEFPYKTTFKWTIIKQQIPDPAVATALQTEAPGYSHYNIENNKNLMVFAAYWGHYYFTKIRSHMEFELLCFEMINHATYLYFWFFCQLLLLVLINNFQLRLHLTYNFFPYVCLSMYMSEHASLILLNSPLHPFAAPDQGELMPKWGNAELHFSPSASKVNVCVNTPRKYSCSG